ncbi:MAG: glycoside hydrolase family 99-like domain-containing protein [Bacteroidota bacterium]
MRTWFVQPWRIFLLGALFVAVGPRVKAAGSPIPLTVGAYYYSWYGPYSHWDEGYTHTPLLGLYDSRDCAVARQHVLWAKSAGIDFFAVSWWGPGKREELALREGLLPELQEAGMRFCILYETWGRIPPQNVGGRQRINVDQPEVLNRFTSDLSYLAETYFGSPSYLRIDGKPVVILYLTRTLTGDVESAIRTVRAAVNKLGYDLYLIGDEVYWAEPKGDSLVRACAFDAVTSYNMHSASIPSDCQEFLARTTLQYDKWIQIARQHDFCFVPATMPGFNDSAVRPSAAHPVIARSVEFVRSYTTMALEHVDSRMPMLLITSWNEWHEDTQIEPSSEEGDAYLSCLHSCLAEMRFKP